MICFLSAVISCDNSDTDHRIWYVADKRIYVYAIGESRDYYWVSAQEKILRISKNDGDTLSITYGTQGFPANAVGCFFPADSGRIWMGTGGGGLLLVDTIVVRRYTTSNSQIPSNGVQAIAQSSDGVFWLATNGGLVKFDNHNFTTYNTNNSGLPANALTSVGVGDDNSVWAGTWGFNLARFKENQWTIFTKNNSSLQTAYIFTLLHTGKTLWVGEGGGINRYTASGWKNYNSKDTDLPQNDVTTIVVDKYGLWVGTYAGGVGFLKSETWTVYNTTNSELPDDQVTAMFADRRGRLWVGFYRGLAVFQ